MSLFALQDSNDLGKYVERCEMAFTLAGHDDDQEIFKMIVDSFNETSRAKLAELGLVIGEFTSFQLERVLKGPVALKTLDEELAVPQKAEESVQFYVKRLKKLLPLFGDDAPCPDEFIDTFITGLHPNLRESAKDTILEQVKRLPRRSLKETIEQLETTLKVIMDSSKDRSLLKPRNTCNSCLVKKQQEFNLDDLLDEVAVLSD